MLLQNKIGIVFGASSKYSLGYHVARAWTQAQASRILLACETEELCDKVMREAKRDAWWNDATCAVMKCNVNLDADLAQVFTTHASVDMVLHSVAFAPKTALQQPLLSLTRDDFAQTMETSAYSLLSIAKHARFHPVTGGSLISLTFNASRRVVPGYGAMAPAKACLETLSLYLADELGAKKVRCNCISPGPINTPAARAIPRFHEMVTASQQRSPLQRSATNQDVANAAVFLASDLACGITGQIFQVDCGESLKSS